MASGQRGRTKIVNIRGVDHVSYHVQDVDGYESHCVYSSQNSIHVGGVPAPLYQIREGQYIVASKIDFGFSRNLCPQDMRIHKKVYDSCLVPIHDRVSLPFASCQEPLMIKQGTHSSIKSYGEGPCLLLDDLYNRSPKLLQPTEHISLCLLNVELKKILHSGYGLEPALIEMFKCVRKNLGEYAVSSTAALVNTVISEYVDSLLILGSRYELSVLNNDLLSLRESYDPVISHIGEVLLSKLLYEH
jgi:hypothetical protein